MFIWETGIGGSDLVGVTDAFFREEQEIKVTAKTMRTVHFIESCWMMPKYLVFLKKMPALLPVQ